VTLHLSLGPLRFPLELRLYLRGQTVWWLRRQAPDLGGVLGFSKGRIRFRSKLALARGADPFFSSAFSPVSVENIAPRRRLPRGARSGIAVAQPRRVVASENEGAQPSLPALNGCHALVVQGFAAVCGTSAVRAERLLCATAHTARCGVAIRTILK